MDEAASIALRTEMFIDRKRNFDDVANPVRLAFLRIVDKMEQRYKKYEIP